MFRATAGITAAPAEGVDADGDRLEDTIEVELGIDTADLEPDDDGATASYGVLDGGEIVNGTDPNDPNSF